MAWKPAIGRPFRRLLAVLAGLALVLGVIGAEANPAWAQQSPVLPGPPTPPPVPPSSLQVIATPYLWLANINSAIGTRFPRAPDVDSSVGAFQLLGHLDAMPFMGSLEVRDGPFSLLGDAFHVPVGTNITTRNVFFDRGNASLIANQGTAAFLYHWLDQPVQTLDVGGGFRAWSYTANVTLNGRIARTVQPPPARPPGATR